MIDIIITHFLLQFNYKIIKLCFLSSYKMYYKVYYDENFIKNLDK